MQDFLKMSQRSRACGYSLATKGSKINFEELKHGTLRFVVAPTMHVPIHDTVLGTRQHHSGPMPTNTHMFSYPRGNDWVRLLRRVRRRKKREGRGKPRERGRGVHSVGRKVAKARVLKRNLGQRADQREWQSPGFIVVSNTRAELSRTIFSRDEVRGYLTLCAVVTCFAPSVHA